METKPLPLSACPFCGAEHEVYMFDELTGNTPGLFQVTCDGCRANGTLCDTPDAAIAAWNKRAPGWVSVKERLPEKRGYYFADMRSDCADLLWFEDGEFWDSELKAMARLDVLHWHDLPLPPAPKDEEGMA